MSLGQNYQLAQIEKPGPVLLLGAPGVGKGTQSDILSKLWNVPKISTGEILRANVSNGTALGLQANDIMKRGGLVSDRVMTQMVARRLGDSDTSIGFILDGFPRTVRQARWLDSYLNVHRRGAILGIIVMRMDHQRIVERVRHRSVCPVCNTVYNAQLMPPKRNGRCDKDDSALEQRNDDSVEVFQTRLNVFRKETEPLIQYYRGQALSIDIDAEQQPSFVTRDIVEGLTVFRKRMLLEDALPESPS